MSNATPKRSCAKCLIALRPLKNGVDLVVMAYDPPEPYQIWAADVWHCPNCDLRVVVGFSENCHERHHPDFLAAWERTKRIRSVEAGTLIIQYESIEDAQTYGANLPNISAHPRAESLRIVKVD